MSKEFEGFLKDAGIARQHTVRNEPHQNGVAEHANRTLQEGITAMLNESKLSHNFWDYALNALVYVRNRSPTSANTNSCTPFEKFYGHKPDVSNLRVFGCLAYVHVQKDQRKGLQSHSRKCIFIGYPAEYKAWTFYDLATKKISTSNNAVFDERVFPGTKLGQVPDLQLPPPSAPDPAFFFEDEEPVDQVGVRQPVVYAPHPPPPQDPAILPDAPPVAPPVLPIPAPAPQPELPAPVRRQLPARQRQPPPDWKRSVAPAACPAPAEPVQLPPLDAPLREPQVGPIRVRQPVQNLPHFADPVRKSSRVTRPPGQWWTVANRNPPAKPAQDADPPPEPAPVDGAEPQDSDSHSESGDDGDFASLAAELKEQFADDDDGHEDMNEITTCANLAAASDFMQSETIDMSPLELLDLAFTEMAATADASPDCPRTLKEAFKRPDRDFWYNCALDEIRSLEENGTFTVRERRPGDRPIGARWVLRVKRKADGSIERYKGRVVAKGFSQCSGIDFDEVFSPTAKWAALRAIFALAALEDMEIESVDISSAFLNGELDEEITMEIFEGLHEMCPELFKKSSSKRDSDWVLELNKALYGLKQGPRQWHKKLHEAMTGIGFLRVQCDNSIWVYAKDETRVIVPVYVDDMTIVARTKAQVKWVKDELKKCFKLRDLGPVSFFLGVQVMCNREKCTLCLSQHQAIIDMLAKFDMSDCNPVTTPLDPGHKLSVEQCPQTEADALLMRSVPYQEAVGTLMYLAIATRPDISYAVGVLSRFCSNPGPAHWKAVKHLFRYLKGTMDVKLTYAPDPASKSLFTTYSDADSAGNADNLRSTSGYVVKMGTGAVSWASRLQTINTLSTTEAEYVSAVSATQEILWLRNLFTEMGFPVTDLPLYIDNMSALSVAKNPEHHGRMKHLDLCF